MLLAGNHHFSLQSLTSGGFIVGHGFVYALSSYSDDAVVALPEAILSLLSYTSRHQQFSVCATKRVLLFIVFHYGLTQIHFKNSDERLLFIGDYLNQPSECRSKIKPVCWVFFLQELLKFCSVV